MGGAPHGETADALLAQEVRDAWMARLRECGLLRLAVHRKVAQDSQGYAAAMRQALAQQGAGAVVRRVAPVGRGEQGTPLQVKALPRRPHEAGASDRL